MAYGAAAVAPTDSRVGEGKGKGEGLGGRTLERHDAELEAHLPQLRGLWDGGVDSVAMAAAVGRVLGSSGFLSDGWRAPAAAAAAALLTRGDDAAFVAVVCPALEHALRRRFAAVNAAPEVLLAQAGCYYATLDGYGQAHVHDVLLHPLRPPSPAAFTASSTTDVAAAAAAAAVAGSVVGSDPIPSGVCASIAWRRRRNLLPDTLPPGVRSALEDLFMRDRGPALRAVYAHGSVRLQPLVGEGVSYWQTIGGRGGSSGGESGGSVSNGGERSGGGGACARLLLLAMLDLCAAYPHPCNGDKDASAGAVVGCTADEAEVGIDWRADTIALAARGATVREYTPRFHPAIRLRAALDGAAGAVAGLVGGYTRNIQSGAAGTVPLAVSPPRFTFTVTAATTTVAVAPTGGGGDVHVRIARGGEGEGESMREGGALASFPAAAAADDMDPKTSALMLVYDNLRPASCNGDTASASYDTTTVNAHATATANTDHLPGVQAATEARAGFLERAGKLGASAAADERALLDVVRTMLDATGYPSSTSNTASSSWSFSSVSAHSSSPTAAAATAVQALAARLLLGTVDVPTSGAVSVLPPGPSPGTECLRAAADEVSAAAAAYQAWTDRMVSAVERREARSNHRRQLGAMLHGQRSVAAGLLAALLAAEGLAVRVEDQDADDESRERDVWDAYGDGELGLARQRVLTYAMALRSACEAGQAAEAARVAASLWEQNAGRSMLACLKRRGALKPQGQIALGRDAE
jgi:hypothetical protein